jgi:NADH-quinone oxidoreductase subunit N
MLYGLSGSTNLRDIAASVSQRNAADPLTFLALATTTVGLLFKISAAPFHMWAPDAYEGAPTSVTAYLSVGSKAASFAILLRFFLEPLGPTRQVWLPILIAVSLVSLTIGNLAAISQTNIKRLLAYSGISHAGYMLLGLVAGNETGIKGIAVYLIVYTFMTLGALLVIVAMRRADILGEDIDDVAGLVQRHPAYAIFMLVFLLSLAGIPPTAGFLGKYYIFLALVETGHYALAVIATLYVAVSLYYYFRIVRSMFVREGGPAASMPLASSFGVRIALGITGALTLIIGIFPEPFLRYAGQSLFR